MKSEVGEKAASKTSFKEEMTEKIDKQTKRKMKFLQKITV